jgi:hypothetical protein
MRMLSMIGMLAVLWMMIERASDPATWIWLANDPLAADHQGEAPLAADHQAEAKVAAHAKTDVSSKDTPPLPAEKKPAWTETIVPGPNDTDPAEVAAAAEEFQALTQRQAIAAEEMPAYWRLMRWSRSASFDELARRARHDVFFTHLWEQPDKYFGKLIELRLHLKRVLPHDAPENSAGVKTVYEAWGWTEDSKSFPYVLVFSELPPNMPIGAEIHEEATFVGYFFKQLPYQAYDVHRAAPVLIGRMRWREDPVRAILQHRGNDYFWPALGIGSLVLLAIIGSWVWTSTLGAKRVAGRGAKRSAIRHEPRGSYQDWLEEQRSDDIDQQSRAAEGSRDSTRFPKLDDET